MTIKVPSTEKLKFLFDTAKKYKEEVLSELNECFELADNYFKIEDSAERKAKTVRDIDFSIIHSRKFLANFTMSNVFNRNNAWAKIQISKEVYMRINKGVDDGLAQDSIDDANIILEKNSTTCFSFINSSNLYTEASKAIKSAQFGTGIIKINKINSKSKPFSFEYMGYDNIYFTEDALGSPVIVFKKHFPMNSEEMIDKFASYKNFTPPQGMGGEEDFNQKLPVTEVMVGIFDENTGMYTYYNAVLTDNYEETLAFEWTPYPKFIVFRWEIEGSNVWGSGPARDNKGLFKELKENKEKRTRHRDKIVDPPGMWKGNVELMYKAKLGAGDISYGGTGNPGMSDLGYTQINTGTNLIPLEQDINEQRNAVKNAFLAQPLGTTEDAVKSATEQAIRIDLFNKEWSTTGELINSEVLYPIFTACYQILEADELLEKPSLETDENYLKFTELLYMNELTKNTGIEDVNQVLTYYNMVGATVPEEWRDLLLKPEEFSSYAAEKMRIPKAIVPSKAEIKSSIEQKREMQMQLLQSQIAQQQGGMPVE